MAMTSVFHRGKELRVDVHVVVGHADTTYEVLWVLNGNDKAQPFEGWQCCATRVGDEARETERAGMVDHPAPNKILEAQTQNSAHE